MVTPPFLSCRPRLDTASQPARSFRPALPVPTPRVQNRTDSNGNPGDYSRVPAGVFNGGGAIRTGAWVDHIERRHAALGVVLRRWSRPPLGRRPLRMHARAERTGCRAFVSWPGLFSSWGAFALRGHCGRRAGLGAVGGYTPHERCDVLPPCSRALDFDACSDAGVLLQSKMPT